MQKIGNFLLFQQAFVDCDEPANAIVNIDAIESIIEKNDSRKGGYLLLSTTDSEILMAGNPVDLWIELVEILKGT